MAIDPDPAMTALAVTIGLAHQLIDTKADTTAWAALTDALAAEHTPAELANLLVGACTLVARGPVS